MRELCVNTRGSRLVELDGLRGIAVLMVLVWHFFGALINTKLGWWAQSSYRVFILGRTGVDLFFVLSGFLITRIIISKTSCGFQFLQTFYTKRVLRIFPPYFLLVGIFWSAVLLGENNSIFNGVTPFWRHLTFTQNFWMSETNSWGPGGISVSWSVAIEEQYYLFFPIFALVLPRRFLPSGLCVIAATSILCRGLLHYYFPGNAYLSYVMTLSRLDGLAVGGLVAWAFSDNDIRNLLFENEVKLRKLFRVLVFVVPLLAISLRLNIVATMFYWGHTYLTLLYALSIVLVLMNAGSDLTKFFRSAFLSYFGRISYSIYLFHPLILSNFFLFSQRTERISQWADAGVASLAFIFTLVACTALYQWYEKPILQYGKRWKY